MFMVLWLHVLLFLFQGVMCLLFIYIGRPEDGDRYKLILANNRDEYLSRPTGTAEFRGDNIPWIGGTYG